METQPDYEEMCAALNDAGVEFLVVGAHALAAHGHVRATKDLDIWVRPSLDNAARVMQALHAFGAPTQRVSVDDFAVPDIVYQIGVNPVRIDILTVVSGLDFENAWTRRVPSRYAGQPVFVLSMEDLIVNKRASGRPQDLADVAALEQMKSLSD